LKWIVVGMKWMKIGTKQALVETGNMIRDYNDDDGYGGWGSFKMVPETEWREVDWNQDMPYVIGIFDYDPTEEFEGKMSMTRIYTYEESDITSLPPPSYDI
jgi:hypothetical protein